MNLSSCAEHENVSPSSTPPLVSEEQTTIHVFTMGLKDKVLHTNLLIEVWGDCELGYWTTLLDTKTSPCDRVVTVWGLLV
jgi:hypothetical protein